MGIRTSVFTTHEETVLSERDLLDASMRIEVPHKNAFNSTTHENRFGRMTLHLTNMALMPDKNIHASEVIIGIRLANTNSMCTIYIEKTIKSDEVRIHTIGRQETSIGASLPAHRFDLSSTRNNVK